MSLQVAARRVWVQLTADRRRFRALLVTAGVAGILWMKPLGLLLWARLRLLADIPRTAMAEPGLMTDAGGPPEGLTPSPAPLRIVLDEEPRHDPFVVSDRDFPRPTPGPVIPEEPDKSASERAEGSIPAHTGLARQLQAIVASFKLEAAMQGNPPVAVINGQTFRPGDTIASPDAPEVAFGIVSIGSRTVTVESQGYEFTIRMASPIRP